MDFLLLLGILLTYMIGSIPTAVWVGKAFYNIDVRTQGSGNAGATNTIRVLGLKAGIPVLLVDVMKGFFAIKLMQWFLISGGGEPYDAYWLLAASVAVVIGHTFPLWAGFRGGKGVATLLGVGFGLFPFAALTALLVFIVVLLISRYVSLSSLAAGIGFPFLVFFVFPADHWIFYALAIAVAIFLPFTHRKNISRLLSGTESKLVLRKKDHQEKL
ncbi:MAG: glycerol-3-phosphate 1-O-acyltransferase PlsY [Bacteroidales bacterium]|nr:glycerol-3-phosphate 1-O-acyltransferase PlsY [Bacteroidales bacterium]